MNKMKEITSIIIIGFILLITQPCQAVTKCYKEICVGDTVLVIGGLYKGNYAKILDIIKERIPEEDEVEIRDLYKYFVSFNDGTVIFVYRDELK